MKPLTLFLLSLTFASQGWGQVQMDRIAPAGVNNVLYAGTHGYPTIQSAIDASASGGTVVLPQGNYPTTSTISITKALTLRCDNQGSTTITPSNAVTGSVISINPSTQQVVKILGCVINMASVPSIPAVLANNMANGWEIGWVTINGPMTIGIDLTNDGIGTIHDFYIYNPSSFGIRDNGDGGTEHTFKDGYLVNNNNAVNTNALFEAVRTTTTDTGGLYMYNIKAVQNVAGGVVTNAYKFLGPAVGGPVLGHVFSSGLVADGVTGQDAFYCSNFSRLKFENLWAISASTLANSSAFHADTNCNQLQFSDSILASINGKNDFYATNTVDYLTFSNTQFFGPGNNIAVDTGTGKTHWNWSSNNAYAGTPLSNPGATFSLGPINGTFSSDGTSSYIGNNNAASLFFQTNGTPRWGVTSNGTLQSQSGMGLTIQGAGLNTLGQTTVASLPSAASNPGAMILVTDSTAVASEGQTCVGSSTNKAVAVSNGSVWKCF